MPARLRYRLLAILLFLAIPTGSLQARKVLIEKDYGETGEVSFRITSHYSQIPSHGYLPVLIEAKNKSQLPRHWSLTFNSSSSSSSDSNELKSSISFTLPPGAKTHFEHIIPLVTCLEGTRTYSYGSSLQIDVSNPPNSPNSTTEYSESEPKKWPSLLISESVYTANASLLEAEVKKHTKHGGSIPVGSTYSPKLLSSDWRAYSGFDALLLTPEEWQKLPSAPRLAIQKWQRLGGHIYLIARQAPDLAQLGLTADSSQSPHRSAGATYTLKPGFDGRLAPDQTVTIIRESTLAGSRLKQANTAFLSNWPLAKQFGVVSFNSPLYFVILLAFAICVGPLNLFVFAKRGRRHRLFITTPIISLSASLLLILVILLQDGSGGKGARLIHLELRSGSEENQAYLYQEQLCRTGVLFNNTIPLPDQTTLTPILIPDTRWARLTSKHTGSHRYRQDTTKQPNELTGDYFQSRCEQGHILLQTTPSRARIQLLPGEEGTAPRISSTLSYSLDELYYLAPDGQWWHSTKIAPGSRTTLTLSTLPQANAWLNQQSLLFTKEHRKTLRELGARQNHYIAIATGESAPALASLPSVKWQHTTTLITGNLQ